MCIVSFRCYVFCLLLYLVKLSLLAKWLARMTPPRKPNCGDGIVSRKPRPKSAHDFLGLLYCFIVLLCICVVSCPYVIYYPPVMARYSLFVLKVPLNPKQTKQTNKHVITSGKEVVFSSALMSLFVSMNGIRPVEHWVLVCCWWWWWWFDWNWVQLNWTRLSEFRVSLLAHPSSLTAVTSRIVWCSGTHLPWAVPMETGR